MTNLIGIKPLHMMLRVATDHARVIAIILQRQRFQYFKIALERFRRLSSRRRGAQQPNVYRVSFMTVDDGPRRLADLDAVADEELDEFGATGL